MAWSGWPVTSSTDVNKYEHFIQLWRACRERHFAANAGENFWPRYNIIHSSGTVMAISSGSMTANPGYYNARPVEPDGSWGENEWYNYDDGENDHIPRFYDLIIDYNTYNEEYKVVKARILPHPTGDTINIEDITKYVTMGWIDSLSSLIGKNFYIIRDDGLWWQDRWPQFPNDTELDKGDISSSNHMSIVDSTKSWSTNQFKDKEVLAYNSAGYLYRIEITSNDINTLNFASGNRILQNKYVIVEPGDRADPIRESSTPFYWYGGAKTNESTHYPNDNINSTSLPATFVRYDTGVDCESDDFDAFDIDVWKSYDDDCRTQSSDRCYSPDLFKSLRQIQTFLTGVCYAFVEEKNYDGAKAIPRFVPATLFKKADINWQESTYTPSGEGFVVYNYNLPCTPIDAYWAVLAEEDLVSYGETTLTSGVFSTAIDGNRYSGVMTTGVISFGWTRYFPKEFRYMYDSTAFIPDSDDDGPAMPDPINGSGLYPGTWTTRLKSTNYKNHSVYGYVQDGESGFIGRDLARYSGDNWNDPTLSTDSLYLEYYDHFFEGIRHDQATIDAQMIGFVGSGSHRHLTDYDKNWFGLTPYEGVLRTETGLATAGSSTSLRDATKAGNPYWNNDTGRWSDFILEITTGNASGQKFPITSSETDGTVNYDAFHNYSVSAGDGYRIREPKWNLNRWRDRTVRVTKPDLTTSDITITHSDDNTLFFEDPGFSVASGMVYRIIERRPGGVWKWQDGTGLSTLTTDEAYWLSIDGAADLLLDSINDNWIVPTGIDSRGGTFKSNQNSNLAHATKRYGKLMKGDYIAYHVWDELYRTINALVWTKNDVTWAAQCPEEDPMIRPDGAPDNPDYVYNSITVGGTTFHLYTDETWSECEDRIWGQCIDHYTWGNYMIDVFGTYSYVSTPCTHISPPPYGPILYATSTKSWQEEDEFHSPNKNCDVIMHETIFQPIVQNISTCIPCSKEVYIYTTKLEDLPDIDIYYSEYENIYDDWGAGLEEDRFKLVASSSDETVSMKYWPHLTTLPTQSSSPPGDCIDLYGFPCVSEPRNNKYPDMVVSRVDAAEPIQAPADEALLTHKRQGFRTTQSCSIMKWDFVYAT